MGTPAFYSLRHANRAVGTCEQRDHRSVTGDLLTHRTAVVGLIAPYLITLARLVLVELSMDSVLQDGSDVIDHADTPARKPNATYRRVLGRSRIARVKP